MKKLLLLVTILFISLQSQAAIQKPLLFQITKGSNSAYLFGSIHMGINYSELPAVVNEKFNAASTLIVEADVEAATPLIQQAMAIPENVSLKTKLTDAEWLKVVETLSPLGLTAEKIEFFNIATLTSTYSLVTSQVPQIAEPIDMFMVQVAKSTNKKIDFLESYLLQIDILNKTFDIKALKKSIAEEPEVAIQSYNNLIATYESGDPELVYMEVVKQLPELDQLDYLLLDRNRSWIPVIGEKILEPGIEMFVVGAGHLGGPEGVINLLRAEGYAVTPIQ